MVTNLAIYQKYWEINLWYRATIPPFGIFIEGKYKDEGDGKGSLLAHERIHWEQYQKMGFFNFYYEYLSEYIKHGRVNNHWMEVKARILSN